MYILLCFKKVMINRYGGNIEKAIIKGKPRGLPVYFRENEQWNRHLQGRGTKYHPRF